MSSAKVVNASELMEQIRREVAERSQRAGLGEFGRTGVGAPVNASQSINGSQFVGDFDALRSEIEALQRQVEAGEPRPASPTFRDRAGALVKRRLYRLLWWQGINLKSLLQVVGKQSNAISGAIADLYGTMFPFSEGLAGCRRAVSQTQERLQKLETAQLRIQMTDVQRNANGNTDLRAEVEDLKCELKTALQRLSEVEDRVHAESVERQQLWVRFQDLNNVAAWNTEFRAALDDLGSRLQAQESRGEQLNRALEGTTQQVEVASRHGHLMESRISELGSFTHQTRTALSLQDRRLSLFIEEARRRLPERLSVEQLQMMATQQNEHKYDALYVAFEDVFRGSRSEIKARQSIYLPYLLEHSIGSEAMPVLDLGCGRGEWLEVLRENNLYCTGVDRNDLMIDFCKSAGFDVVQSDALAYLRSLSDNSQGAITSFHMIEHLPFELTLTLIDEALRVLKPGGILILETPNPQNIAVGAHTFYLDPTHIRPLPSPMLRFFVEGRGFCNANVWELHPYPSIALLPDDGGPGRRLNECFYGPQDYAVVANKASLVA